MKRQSDTSSPSISSPPDPTFFTDRDLGKEFPRLLRRANINLVSYFEAYPGEDKIADHVWLRRIGEEKWIGLTKDNNIKKDLLAKRTVWNYSARVFIIRSTLPHGELTEMLIEAMPSILRIVKRTAGPFIGSVHRRSIRGGAYHAEARIWRKHEDLKPS